MVTRGLRDGAAGAVLRRGSARILSLGGSCRNRFVGFGLVDLDGFEPSTSSMPWAVMDSPKSRSA